ncbi:Late embryogenesis abundant (LEA) hydroxyproline-rich glycoprotein family [Euphorbia peplus]|nr:Late embryogenesis abundant (LEA) hydroxyproline-rich glycoprotein family [Euphorbia peplus]
MTDQQKIHPLSHDVEAPNTPSVPLMPRNSSKSDQVSSPPPSLRRTLPLPYSKPPKKRSCCCRCFCWTISLILLLILIIGITAGILFLVFRPKVPDFDIERLQITQFNISQDSSLSASFDVTIVATNPNKKIGIYYEGGSHISVWYNGTNLSQGSLPKFYQGHQNTTVLIVPMTGQTQDASGLLTSLQQERDRTGIIPLDLKVKQPVRIKLGKLKLFKVNFHVECDLDVDDLSSDNNISIRNSSCDFKLKL